MADLISRQAAIDAIMGQPPEPHYPSWYADIIKALPSAQQDIEQQLDSAYKHGYSDCFSERRWIPVSERLPNEDEVLYDGIKTHGTREMSDRVLAIDKTGFIKTGYFINTSHTHSDGKKWEFGDHYDNEPENWIVTSTYHEPIAWMPLPKPYRKEREIG